MKIPVILGLLIIFAIVTVVTDGKREKELHITSLEIKFNKTDAIFTIHYDFDKFSKTFFLLLGTKTLEPKIKSLFPDLEYDVIKIDQNKAIIRVKNISRLDKDYYLHDSHKFSDIIDTVYISDTSSTIIREYHNINSTPNYFYHS